MNLSSYIFIINSGQFSIGSSSILSMRQRWIRVMTLLSPSDLPSLMVKRLESFSAERSVELRGFGRKILAICCKVDGGIGFEKSPRGGWYCWSNPLVVHSKVSPAHVMLGETCFSTYRFHRKTERQLLGRPIISKYQSLRYGVLIGKLLRP